MNNAVFGKTGKCFFIKVISNRNEENKSKNNKASTSRSANTRD